MNNIKYFVLIILSSAVLSVGASAQAKKKIVPKTKKTVPAKPAPKPMNNQPVNASPGDYKILLEGSYSKVETPFVFVARDAETYALIRNMVEGLPASSTVDFGKTAVVAAFAGERSSAGWSVNIAHSAGKTAIDARGPGKGTMSAQVIATPFKIAVVPVSETQPLRLEIGQTWTSRMKIYRISKGAFEYTGGIAGRTKKYNAEGTVGVLTYGDRVTYNFNLAGKGGGNQAMKLFDTASGALNAGQIEIARIETGTFAEIPHAPLKATGTATDRKISLTFESHPPTIADGFTASGKLEAVKIN